MVMRANQSIETGYQFRSTARPTIITTCAIPLLNLQNEQDVERNVLNQKVELSDGTTDYIFSRNPHRNEAKMFTYNCHICSVPNLPGERCLYTHIGGRKHHTKLTLKPFNASLFRTPLQRSNKSRFLSPIGNRHIDLQAFSSEFQKKKKKMLAHTHSFHHTIRLLQFSFVKQFPCKLRPANRHHPVLKMKSKQSLRFNRISIGAKIRHLWGLNIYWSW